MITDNFNTTLPPNMLYVCWFLLFLTINFSFTPSCNQP